MLTIKRCSQLGSLALAILFSIPAIGQPLDLNRDRETIVLDQVLNGEQQDLRTNREIIVDFLVSQQVDAAEAEERVGELTDEEVQQIVVDEGLDQQPIGQDSTVTIGVGTALLIGLLLLLL